MSREKEIADAAVAAINALSLAGAPTAVSQKLPTLPQGTEPPQLLVVVRKRAAVEYLTAESNLHSFDGTVTGITAGGETLAADDTLPGWMEAIADRFDKWTTWNGVGGVSNFNDVHVAEVDFYDRTIAGRTLNYATLRFSVETKEAKP